MRNHKKLPINKFNILVRFIRSSKKWENIASTFVFIGFMTLAVNVSAQNLRLVLGQYECVSNRECAENRYCDIDEHICKELPVCEVCETCEICPTPEVVEPGVTPEICPAGKYNLNGVCVACLSYADCSEDMPVCDSNGTCRRCEDDKDCFGDLKCHTETGRCVNCITDGECAEKCDLGTNTCVLCRDLNGRAQPVFDTQTGTCKTCRDISLETPVWNGVGCEKCPDDYVWDDETGACKIITCKKNSDCADGRYCRISRFLMMQAACANNYNYYTNLSGICQPVGGLTKTEITGLGTVNSETGKGTIYKSKTRMNWWSAKNWCEAQGLTQLSIAGTKLKCYRNGTTTLMSVSAGSGASYGYCCASGKRCGSNTSDISLNSVAMRELREAWPDYTGFVSTSYTTGSNSCLTYYLNFRDGQISYTTRDSMNLYALCSD